MRHRSWLLAAATLLFAACVPQPAPYTGGDVAELQRVDQTVGSGDEAVPGKNVTVHYSGWLYEQTAADKHGKPFDSSHNRGEPFTFPLGAGQVIKGWDEGVAGMRVGGKRTLLIPAEYGYGARGAGRAIPPGASLVFDVELLKVE